MDKIKIGIPRALHYYYYGEMWKTFLEELGFEVIISPETTKEILENGCRIANDEMCLSLKIYFGHVHYLEGRCDYILVPRIDNYGTYKQTCTNFLGLYDMVKNLFHTPLITYDVNVSNGQTEMKGLVNLGIRLGKGKEESRLAYFHSLNCLKKNKEKKQKEEIKKIKEGHIRLLVLSHPYNFLDRYIGSEIQRILKELNITLINGAYFTGKESCQFGQDLSPNLYWKYSKELIGTISILKEQIDGILFLSSFPCGPDSLVNEFIMRKVKLPYLNVIIDEESGSAGMETRLESFIDILEQKAR